MSQFFYSASFNRKFKAACKYTPENITHALKRDNNGIVYADRSMLVHNEDEAYEYILALDFSYRLGFGKDERDATIYLKVDGDTILGGVYYPNTQQRDPAFVVGVRLHSPADNRRYWFPSVYHDEQYYKLCELINSV